MVRIDDGGGGPTLNPKAKHYERELFKVFSVGTGSIYLTESDWKDAKKQLEDLSKDVKTVRSELEAPADGSKGWTGPAADAALSSLKKLSETLDTHAVEVGGVKLSLNQIYTAVTDAQASWYSEVSSISTYVNPDDHMRLPAPYAPTAENAEKYSVRDPDAAAAAEDALWEQRNQAAKKVLDQLGADTKDAKKAMPIEVSDDETDTPYTPQGSTPGGNYPTNTTTSSGNPTWTGGVVSVGNPGGTDGGGDPGPEYPPVIPPTTVHPVEPPVVIVPEETGLTPITSDGEVTGTTGYPSTTGSTGSTGLPSGSGSDFGGGSTAAGGIGGAAGAAGLLGARRGGGFFGGGGGTSGATARGAAGASGRGAMSGRAGSAGTARGGSSMVPGGGAQGRAGASGRGGAAGRASSVKGASASGRYGVPKLDGKSSGVAPAGAQQGGRAGARGAGKGQGGRAGVAANAAARGGARKGDKDQIVDVDALTHEDEETWFEGTEESSPQVWE